MMRSGDSLVQIGKPRTVLIVEDEFLIAMAAEQALLDAGFGVAGVAATFEEAVALAAEKKPDLVLMDIRLASARDGVDAAIEIRSRYNVASLFTSGNQDTANMERAAVSRPAGWLPKPYSTRRLIMTVQDILDPQRRS